MESSATAECPPQDSTQMSKGHRRPVICIVVSILELLFLSGLYALVPLAFSILYRVQVKTNPHTSLAWITSAFVGIVAVIGLYNNLYTMLSLLSNTGNN